MQIHNLSPAAPQLSPAPVFSPKIAAVVGVLALLAGFIFSRLVPVTSSPLKPLPGSSASTPISAEAVKTSTDIKTGNSYGNQSRVFADSATGVLQKGNINGEGTHILVRPGGDSQRVSLTSSNIDLDLFIDRKVEVKGETNSSNKTGWLMDVGLVKVLE